jgi:hypothetical protein
MTPLLRNNLVKLLETWQAEIVKFNKSSWKTRYEQGRFQQIVESIKILKENIPGDLANELDEFLGMDEFKV